MQEIEYIMPSDLGDINKIVLRNLLAISEVSKIVFSKVSSEYLVGRFCLQVCKYLATTKKETFKQQDVRTILDLKMTDDELKTYLRCVHYKYTKLLVDYCRGESQAKLQMLELVLKSIELNKRDRSKSNILYYFSKQEHLKELEELFAIEVQDGVIKLFNSHNAEMTIEEIDWITCYPRNTKILLIK